MNPDTIVTTGAVSSASIIQSEASVVVLPARSLTPGLILIFSNPSALPTKFKKTRIAVTPVVIILPSILSPATPFKILAVAVPPFWSN